MKPLQIWFEDAEFEEIKACKLNSGMTWHDFVYAAALSYEIQERCKDDGR